MSEAARFGLAVRRVRQDGKVNQAAVAEGTGLARNTVNRIELGERQPSLETALKISRYLESETGVAILTMDTKGEVK